MMTLTETRKALNTLIDDLNPFTHHDGLIERDNFTLALEAAFHHNASVQPEVASAIRLGEKQFGYRKWDKEARLFYYNAEQAREMQATLKAIAAKL